MDAKGNRGRRSFTEMTNIIKTAKCCDYYDGVHTEFGREYEQGQEDGMCDYLTANSEIIEELSNRTKGLRSIWDAVVYDEDNQNYYLVLYLD